MNGTDDNCSNCGIKEFAQHEQWQKGEQVSEKGICWSVPVSCFMISVLLPVVSCASAHGTKFSANTIITRIKENTFFIVNEANVFFYLPLTKDKVFLFFCNKSPPCPTNPANIKSLENLNLHQTFEQLLKAHELLVYKICRLYGDTEDDRKDLFQDIVIQLWRAYPKFRGDAKFSTWLYRIGLNVAITQFRKQKNKIYATDIESLNIAIADDNYSTEKDEQFKEMYAAIEKLNAIEKAIVMLYLEDKSYDEMEEILGISNGNLRVKMNRIKEKLRQITKN